MKMIEYLYGGMLVASLILIYFSIQQYNITKELLNTGIKTTGRVIDLIKISDDDGYKYTPVFEYIDYKDKAIRFKSEISSKPTSYKIGDKVNIIYSKNTAQRKIVSFWGLYRWTIVLLCIAFPLIIISLGYFLYTKS